MQCKFHHFEQRSRDWYKIREGKITGTSITSILGELKTKKGEANKTTERAIKNLSIEKAIEQVHGMIETDFVSFDMQRGIDSEPSARDLFREVYANPNFIEVDEIGFASLNEDIGVSPDSILSDSTGLEIKCPNVKNFFKLQLTNEIDESHIDQMQHAMYVTGFKQWHYFVYCTHNNKEHYYHKIIDRDESVITLIKDRCEMVIKMKKGFLEILNEHLLTK